MPDGWRERSSASIPRSVSVSWRPLPAVQEHALCPVWAWTSKTTEAALVRNDHIPCPGAGNFKRPLLPLTVVLAQAASKGRGRSKPCRVGWHSLAPLGLAHASSAARYLRAWCLVLVTGLRATSFLEIGRCSALLK
jgi:hypothetical protein